jgi:hypothetical protein
MMVWACEFDWDGRICGRCRFFFVRKTVVIDTFRGVGTVWEDNLSTDFKMA